MNLDLSNLSFSLLFAGFAFGIVGFYMLKEGRRKANWGIVLIGLALMIYPYFISTAWLSWVIGIGLCFLAYKIW